MVNSLLSILGDFPQDLMFLVYFTVIVLLLFLATSTIRLISSILNFGR